MCFLIKIRMLSNTTVIPLIWDICEVFIEKDEVKQNSFTPCQYSGFTVPNGTEHKQ